MTKPPKTRVRGLPGGRLLLLQEDRSMSSALGALLRYAITQTRDEKECARLCQVSVAKLRAVSKLTGVPLLFPLRDEDKDERPNRLAVVAQQLRAHGLKVRTETGLVILELETAEHLVALLRDLRTIEERGHV
ncbi:hypothetical protein [Nannocystis punicea]|uniref:Uncharacterized protein n=1 Tax=Nannocystis punicea TaxID=2995304 RepID=A0ABY7HBV3_9BACT|nr:hypothetical protein [Nannocystis poenicansa]WAS96676.1 hypothetical protein O0S08_11040 [Nannocystis poenicansa]